VIRDDRVSLSPRSGHAYIREGRSSVPETQQTIATGADGWVPTRIAQLIARRSPSRSTRTVRHPRSVPARRARRPVRCDRTTSRPASTTPPRDATRRSAVARRPPITDRWLRVRQCVDFTRVSHGRDGARDRTRAGRQRHGSHRTVRPRQPRTLGPGRQPAPRGHGGRSQARAERPKRPDPIAPHFDGPAASRSGPARGPLAGRTYSLTDHPEPTPSHPEPTRNMYPHAIHDTATTQRSTFRAGGRTA
jgi:hypothetical protein